MPKRLFVLRMRGQEQIICELINLRFIRNLDFRFRARSQRPRRTYNDVCQKHAALYASIYACAVFRVRLRDEAIISRDPHEMQFNSHMPRPEALAVLTKQEEMAGSSLKKVEGQHLNMKS